MISLHDFISFSFLFFFCILIVVILRRPVLLLDDDDMICFIIADGPTEFSLLSTNPPVSLSRFLSCWLGTVIISFSEDRGGYIN